MDKTWTIESVELVYPPHRDFEMFEEMDGGIPDTVVRGIVRSRMEDGRAFYNETWMTLEFVKDVGEDRARQWVRESSHPPED